MSQKLQTPQYALQQDALQKALSLPAVNQDPNAGNAGGNPGVLGSAGAQNAGAPPRSTTMPVGGGGGGQDVTRQGMGGGGVQPTQGADLSGLHGFDHNNFFDPQMQSVKYRFARLAQKAGARTPSQMAALVLSPEFQREFQGASFDGKDRIDFNGALSDGARGGTPVGSIDVLMGADPGSDTANGVWWGWDENSHPPAGGGMNPLEMGLAQQQQPRSNGSLQTQSLADILAVLQQSQQGYR